MCGYVDVRDDVEGGGRRCNGDGADGARASHEQQHGTEREMALVHSLADVVLDGGELLA